MTVKLFSGLGTNQQSLSISFLRRNQPETPNRRRLAIGEMGCSHDAFHTLLFVSGLLDEARPAHTFAHEPKSAFASLHAVETKDIGLWYNVGRQERAYIFWSVAAFR
jgi:hypothetical protein